MVSFKLIAHYMLQLSRIGVLLIVLIVINSCEEIGFSDAKSKENANLFPVKVNNQYGYIDIQGRMVLAPNYQSAYAFSEGLAVVKLSNKWIFIDAKGETVIDGKGTFQELRPFKDGLAPVKIQNRWGFLNKRGEITINPKFRSVTQFSENRAFVRSLDYRNWFYINKEGVELIADLAANGMDNHDFTEFNNGRALIKDQNLFGYINTNIETVIPISYTDAKIFSDQLAAVKISDKWGYISTDGSIAINPKFIAADIFKEGLAAVRLNTNSWGYINKAGEIVIPEQFEEAKPFFDDCAVVRQNNLYGVIDKKGNWIVEPTQEQIDNFQNGLAKIYESAILENQNSERWFGYINKMGKTVWVPSN